MVTVAAIQTERAQYPRVYPFHPDRGYPEYPFGNNLSEEPNYAYRGVREALRRLELDSAHLDTERWNPLGYLIKPGMTVLLKPNFVLSRHKEGKDVFSIITHPAVLRAVADYCWIALAGKGRIIIGDAPQYDCNFSELLQVTKLEEVCKFYSSFAGPAVEFRDLRNYWSSGRHFPSMVRPLRGDPEGEVVVNLGERSALYGKPAAKLYGAVYHRQETIDNHTGNRHHYHVSKTIMSADVVISIPKLKVHKKVGVTLNAKGLVGINTNKNLIVHYTLTTPREGGDQFPDGLLTPLEARLIRLERFMYDKLLAPRIRVLEYLHRSLYWLHGNFLKPFGVTVPAEKRLFDAGNWYGNDTAWRMVVDLMRIFYFVDKEGALHNTRQRRMFSVVDGIVGGDNKGPLVPDPHPSAAVIAGGDLLAVDLVATRLMGFDPLRLKMYSSLLGVSDCDFGIRDMHEIRVCSNNQEWTGMLSDNHDPCLRFRPYPGWIGHIEACESHDEYREVLVQ
jgi:uncharacterized protein (DUF362 family)